MAGIALLEGLSHPADIDHRHVSMLVIDHAGIQYFDYRGGLFRTIPEDTADYDFGFYWDTPESRVKALKDLLLDLNTRPFSDFKFCLDPETLQARSTASSFNALVQKKHTQPFLLNCITGLAHTIRHVGINCPFLDLEYVTRASDIPNFIRTTPLLFGDHWQTCNSGLVYKNPNIYASYEDVCGTLETRILEKERIFSGQRP